MSPVALFDLDNTMADYLGAMRQGMSDLASPGEEPWEPMGRGKELPHIKARRKLITHQQGWWRNLPTYRPGLEIYFAARELLFDIHFLTKGPRSHPFAWGEKVEWVDRHFPNSPITLSDDKSLVFSKVLVDDWPSYTEPWLQNRPRGLVIMPAHSWNVGCDQHPRVIRYDGTNLDEVRFALQVAYSREPRQEVTFKR